MKAISIYTITRNQNIEHLQKLERQLSGRTAFLKIREWELDSMKALVSELERHVQAVYALHFFYSFQIPRLGKEFDLLQIKEEQILNLELKSGQVSDEAIRKQLIQNRYYLAALGKPIRSYTYISSQNRLVRLTNHDRIVEAGWEQLCRDLQQESDDYPGDIEDLFQAELYLISPLTEPERFLKKEYFLTYQQRDIERQILKKIRTDRKGYFWFTGLPGTGKTLLLYDIAMKLSGRQRVCMIHCGEAGREWKVLHERLRRVEYLAEDAIAKRQAEEFLDRVDETTKEMNVKDGWNVGNEENAKQRKWESGRKGWSGDSLQMGLEIKFEAYSAILVDEAHLLSLNTLKILLEIGKTRPVIFSSNCEDMISPEELDLGVMKLLEKQTGIQTFHLTNRIRANAELSYFIQNMMHLPHGRGMRRYPHVAVVYANDEREAANLLDDYVRQGYECQEYDCQEKPEEPSNSAVEIQSRHTREVDRMVRRLDGRYYYDEMGYLRSTERDVRRLFYQLSEAKEELALVVMGNEKLYGTLLNLF